MSRPKTTASKAVNKPTPPLNKATQQAEEKKFIKISLIVTLVVFLLLYLLFRGSL